MDGPPIVKRPSQSDLTRGGSMNLQENFVCKHSIHYSGENSGICDPRIFSTRR